MLFTFTLLEPTYVEGEAERCEKKVGGRGRRLEGRKDQYRDKKEGKGGRSVPLGQFK